MCAAADFSIRLNPHDERKAREMAFNSDNYPQDESWRLLRLALHEIDCLREEMEGMIPIEQA